MTYKRCKVLNDTLEKLFNSDFSQLENTEVNIVNNHTEFYLREEFKIDNTVYKCLVIIF